MINMEITLNEQEIELIRTILAPIAEDDGNSNFTRKVAINILVKIDRKIDESKNTPPKEF